MTTSFETDRRGLECGYAPKFVGGGKGRHGAGLSLALVSLLLVAACQPRVALEAPKDPIVINLNVKIEQEVRVKVEDDVEDLFDDNEDLF